MAASSEDRVRRLEFLNQEIAQRLARQVQSTDRIDAKVTVVVGLTLTVIPLVASRPLRAEWAVAALVLAIVAIGLGVACLWPRDFRDVPDPHGLVNRHRVSTYEEIVGALVGTRVGAFRKNERVRKTKVKLWTLTLVIDILAGGCLLIAAVFGKG